MRKVVVIDDLDKESIADETIEFAFEGTVYVLDVTTANAKQFRETMARYIAASHD